MTGQQSLAKWLQGFPTDRNVLNLFLQSKPEFKFTGKIYRGLCSKEEISVYDVELCSWSSSRGMAEQFASYDRHRLVLEKESTGYSIENIRKYLIDNGLMEDCLKYCTGRFEHEIIDSCENGKFKIIERR